MSSTHFDTSGVLDHLEQEIQAGGQPSFKLAPEVRARVEQDMGATLSHLGGHAEGSAQHAAISGLTPEKHAAIVKDYAVDLHEHHSLRGNLEMLDDHSRLSDQVMGNRGTNYVPPPKPAAAQNTAPAAPKSPGHMSEGMADYVAAQPTAATPQPAATAPAPHAPSAPHAPAKAPTPPKKGLLQTLKLQKPSAEYNAKMNSYQLEQAEYERHGAVARETEAEKAFRAKQAEAKNVAEELHGTKGEGARPGKMQALDAAHQDLEAAKLTNDPKQIKAAQQKVLGAQKDVLETKKKLNSLAQEAGELKQVHNEAKLSTQEATHDVHRKLDPRLPEKAPLKLDGKSDFRAPKARLDDKNTALEVRRQELDAASDKVKQAEKQVSKVNDKPNKSRAATQTTLDKAKAEHEAVQSRVDDLKQQRRAQMAEARNTDLPHEQRVEAGRKANLHKEELAKLEGQQQKAQNTLDKAAKKHNVQVGQENKAASAVQRAEQATTQGKYTNTAKPVQVASNVADHSPIYAQQPQRTAADRAAHSAAKAKIADPNFAPRSTVAAQAHHTVPHAAAPAKAPWYKRMFGKGGNAAVAEGAHAITPGAVAQVAQQGAEQMAHQPGALRKAGSFLKGELKGGMKAVAITGLAAAGLYALLEATKKPRAERNNSLDNPADAQMPVVFNPGADVGMGAFATQPMQQQDLGWAARMRAEEPGMGMQRG